MGQREGDEARLGDTAHTSMSCAEMQGSAAFMPRVGGWRVPMHVEVKGRETVREVGEQTVPRVHFHLLRAHAAEQSAGEQEARRTRDFTLGHPFELRC